MAYIAEKVRGIVQRVTYHNPVNGWSVLKVQPFDSPERQVTVTVHQTRVFAGATMEFRGAWTVHPQFGRQFRADEAVEEKPASAAALEKYLGSGLIKGVGPKTAGKIVRYFGKETLRVFEHDIDRLVEVEGIAGKKLEMISAAWREHRQIREVMIFLQGHGISTLFAVRIFKKYGEKAIELVTADPYRLASDFYGIGFFSADRVALSIGLAPDSTMRIVGAVRHVLAAAREKGHCYLSAEQINGEVSELLTLDVTQRLPEILRMMENEGRLRVHQFPSVDGQETPCYYSKTLYYDELGVAEWIARRSGVAPVVRSNIREWMKGFCRSRDIRLSREQSQSVLQVAGRPFSVLTGGPGCGKTTTTLVIVRLLEHLGLRVLLAAPTGRAAQRMEEVIGREAKTIHRLLEWQGGSFQRNEEQPLRADFLIVDECSMLDISLTAALLKAVPEQCGLLFIGDADQLPSVGAGNVLHDIIGSGVVPVFRLTEVFRQAGESRIIRFAHQINSGVTPQIESPFKRPELWTEGVDCLFIDSDESTREQIDFAARVRRALSCPIPDLETLTAAQSPYEFRTAEPSISPYDTELSIPEKFRHVDLQELLRARSGVGELKALLEKVHPWSTLHYGLSAVDSVVQLYLDWIPKYYGRKAEIQILSPMTRGSLGTLNLNRVIQEAANPPSGDKPQLQVGERIFRQGDRVIHRRNNYDLQVFNGDIGVIRSIDTLDMTCLVEFFPDQREVCYQRDDIVELDLAYAITIHKSQGSEFETVILPVLTQHFKMLYRNLIYTGLTRGRKLAVFVGTRRALAMAVRQQEMSTRQTGLEILLRNPEKYLSAGGRTTS